MQRQVNSLILFPTEPNKKQHIQLKLKSIALNVNRLKRRDRRCYSQNIQIPKKPILVSEKLTNMIAERKQKIKHIKVRPPILASNIIAGSLYGIRKTKYKFQDLLKDPNKIRQACRQIVSPFW